MKRINLMVSIFFLSLVACGNENGAKSTGQNKEEETQQERGFGEGTYYTVLRPVNFRANGFIPYGMATFKLSDDQLQVNVSLDDDQPVVHRQALHMGSRCPDMNDDTNGDGFVDYDEAMKVVGPVVMPLDSDLNTQMAGRDVFPRGPAMTYAKQASFQRVNADLWMQDEDPSDELVKLSRGKGISFGGKVILVHGTTNQNFFPLTLSTYRNEPAHLSLPVVCGLLEKID